MKDLPQAMSDVAVFKASLDTIINKVDRSSPPVRQRDGERTVGDTHGTSMKDLEILNAVKSLGEGLEAIKVQGRGSDISQDLKELARTVKTGIQDIKLQLARTTISAHCSTDHLSLSHGLEDGTNNFNESPVTQNRRDQVQSTQVATTTVPTRHTRQAFPLTALKVPAAVHEISALRTTSSVHNRQALAPDVLGPIAKLNEDKLSESAHPNIKNRLQPDTLIPTANPAQAEIELDPSTTSSSSEPSNASGSWDPTQITRSKPNKKRKAPPKPANKSFVSKQNSHTTPIAQIQSSLNIPPHNQVDPRAPKKAKLSQTTLSGSYGVTTGLDLGIMTRARSVSVKKVLGEGVSNENDPIIIGSSSEDSSKRAKIAQAQTAGFIPGIETGLTAKSTNNRAKRGRPRKMVLPESPISKGTKAELIERQPPHDSLNSVDSHSTNHSISQNLDNHVLSSSNPTHFEVDETEDYLLETQFPPTNASQLPLTQSLVPDPDSFIEAQKQSIDMTYTIPPLPIEAPVGGGKAGVGRFQRLGTPDSPLLEVSTTTGIGNGRLTTYGSKSGRGGFGGVNNKGPSGWTSERAKGILDESWDDSDSLN